MYYCNESNWKRGETIVGSQTTSFINYVRKECLNSVNAICRFHLPGSNTLGVVLRRMVNCGGQLCRPQQRGRRLSGIQKARIIIDMQ